MRSHKIGMTAALAGMFWICASAHGADRTWIGPANGDWHSAGNWSPGDNFPQAGESVLIDGGSVLLSGGTAALGEVVITNATVTFTNWTTRLQADTVTIRNGGQLTAANAFSDIEMSNRVSIVCSNFVIESGGTIDVDGLGYKADGINVYGPGAGTSGGNRGSGASYGGLGGRGKSTLARATYGSTNAPTQPGSAGGYGYAPIPSGGNGGGAVRIVATNVVLNGSITANGGNSGSYGGGGSGGAVYITCATLAGTGGVVRADGGDTGSGDSTGTGGGGRIAIDCAQMIGTVDIRFSADYGDIGNTKDYRGRMGTLYFPDTAILSTNLTQLDKIRLFIPGFTSWNVSSLTVSNGGGSFGDGPFSLTVSNDMTIAADTWLSLGGTATYDGFALPGTDDGGTNPLVSVGGDLVLDGAVLTIGGQDQAAAGQIGVDGDLRLTNGASLFVYGGSTNATRLNGARLTVAGTTALDESSWVYPYCNRLDGGVARFSLNALRVDGNSGFDADNKGFEWLGTTCYAPAYGGTASSRGAGSGYGGAGGDRPDAAGGSAYGLTNAPMLPGAPGGYGHAQGPAQPGGGGVRIDAADVTLDGTITACATLGCNYGGGSSGGGIFITSDSFAGSGEVRANGSNGGSAGITGGGGGGRIAVGIGLDDADVLALLYGQPVADLVTYTEHAEFDGTISVANGLGVGDGGEDGEPGTAGFMTKGAYTLTIAGDPGPYGSPSPKGYGTHTDIPQDAWVTNSVTTPADEASGQRHALLGWQVATDTVFDEGTTPPAIFPLTNNMTLTWFWTNEYQLAVSSASPARGSVNTEIGGWYPGTTVVTNILATASNGYMFSQWTGDVPVENQTDNPLSVTMDQARTIQAQFASASALTKVWTGSGLWGSATNWSPEGAPGILDDAHIASGSVLLSHPVWVHSLSVSNGATLVYTNWTSTLNAEEIAVNSGGKITVANAFSDIEMSNRVSIVCANFVIESGGMIDVDGLGFKADGVDIYGPGAGTSGSYRGAGGSYGGIGGGFYSAPRPEYGATNAPLQPGSAGGYGYDKIPSGGNGGGTVRIVATNVTVNGTISANGAASGGTYGGGGSGGAVYITCAGLYGTGGVVRANGGRSGTAGDKGCGSGGGGRIAVDCSNIAGDVDIRFGANHGDKGSAVSYPGRMGSLHFPNPSILSTNLTQLDSVRLFVPGLTEWEVDNLTVRNGGGSFGDGTFRLMVTNDLTLEAGCWLSLGGTPTSDGSALPGALDNGTNPVLVVGGTVRADGATLTLGGLDQNSFGFVEIGGDFLLTNAAAVHIYSGATNATSANGAVLAVVGRTTLAGSSWIYPYCNRLDGGLPRFSLNDLHVAEDSGFDADNKGYDWIGSTCHAPDYGQTQDNRGAGSGYGGAGGDRPGAAGGSAYGLANAPLLPGAPGGYGHANGPAKPGGGGVRIDAADVTLDGTITASATLRSSFGGGSSGGGIFIVCDSFGGAASGVLRADGSDAGLNGITGGGGGGCIAVAVNLSAEEIDELMAGRTFKRLRTLDSLKGFHGTLSATNGVGVGDGGEPGDVGTVRFLLKAPPSGTFMILY